MVRFLRTPKGLLLVIFVAMLAAASVTSGGGALTLQVAVAGAVAAGADVGFTYARRAQWILPDGAVLTGMIVAFILRPQQSWLVLIGAVALAIVSKHALRTRWSNIFNPAALALVAVAVVLQADQDWWGALPDLGITGIVVVLVTGAFIANRLNKLPMILAFFAAYFALLTFASFFDSSTVAETFRTPDLQAALFFAFFMLDDPPTSPVRYEDQIVFGIVVATVAYFVFTQFGGVYFLPAGLLAGNLWESARRVVVTRLRSGVVTLNVIGHTRRYKLPTSAVVRNLRVIAGAATAIITLVLLVVASVNSSSKAPDAVGSELVAANPTPAPSPTPTIPATGPYAFVPTFHANLTGTYTQTRGGTATDLTVDATTDGDVVLKLHLELATAGGAGGAQPTVTVNKAQVLDPNSNAVICDGQFSSYTSNVVRATCSGSGPYAGVQITFAPTMRADSATTLSGTIDGSMQRVP